MNHKFEIKTEYHGIQEKLYVFLDDRMIFEVDSDKYYGHTRNNEPALCKKLSEILKREITPKELSTARILGYFRDKAE